MKTKIGFFHEAILDDEGQVDIAYLSLAWVTFSILGTIFLISVLSVFAYFRCSPTELVQARIVDGLIIPAVPSTICNYDPLPVGQAVGMICGGYAAALGALAAYMAATRRQSSKKDLPKEGI